MTDHQDIDFSKIRPVHGDQKHGFEELVCQLGWLEPPSADARYFRGDGRGGDGGVEAYWTLADGAKVAYQAKCHLSSGDIDWAKLDGSVRTAMAVHSTIRRYVIAFPCNLTPITARAGKGRPQKSGQERWDEHVARWGEAYPGVAFDRWDEFELIRRLTGRPEAAGLRAWFFNLPHWTADWFRDRFEIAARDLGDRYHADEHVAVSAGEAFDGLVRGEALKSIVEKAETDLRYGVALLTRRDDMFRPELDPDAYSALMAGLGRLTAISDEYPRLVTDTVPYRSWLGLVDSALTSIGALVARIPEMEASPRSADPIIAVHFRIALRQVEEALSRPAFLADERRAVLLTGPAGIGKSHLLAKVADRATRDGLPALIVPGQWLNASSDPWPQIRSKWDAERFSNNEVLGALNAAAQAANRRALILIDALNESGDAGGWRDHLGGFVAGILRYPCLAVAVSCRSDYLKWVVPDAVRGDFVTVESRGFVSEEEREQAAQVFLDRNGIARPAAPWLAPDFTNPLFLRVTAQGLKAAGQSGYPDFVGLPDFFRFFLNSLSVRPPFYDWEDRTLLSVCLHAIAQAMVKAGRQWLALSEAVGAIRVALADHDGDDGVDRARRLLGDLKRGAVLPMPDPDAQRPAGSTKSLPDGFSFVFQRLGELLMAEAVVDRVEAASFVGNGDLAFVGRDPEAWSGLLGALAILLPQRHKVELFDLAKTLRQNREVAQRQFRDSLLWRPGGAFLPATEAWFDWLDEHYRLEVAIRLSVTPHHPWNADRLDGRLRPLTLAERDVEWSIPLASADYDAEEAINQILDWALGENCVHAAEETLRLSATLLAWMLTTSARKIRDRATKALARLFLLRPGIMAGILNRFHDVNDPYVVERLWASAYGAAMNGLGDAELGRLAERTWALCFDGGQPPVSLLTRDHALGIMELAETRRVLPAHVVMDRCRPPFVTAWPLEEVEPDLIDAQRNEQGAWDVVSSVFGGDFGRYELESALRSWSNTPLSAPPPRTGQEVFDDFHARFVSAGAEEVRAAWANYEKSIQICVQEIWDQLLANPTVDDLNQCDRDVAQIDALAEFLAALPNNVVATAERIISERQRQIETFDKARAREWLVKRVLDLGWRAESFSIFDRQFSGESHGHQPIERVGKKYQWIALDELLARLSDNVHHIGRRPERIMAYRTSADQPFVRDCDPSIISVLSQNEPPAWWEAEVSLLQEFERDDMRNWVHCDQDVQCSSGLFNLYDSEQRPWLLLYGQFERVGGDGAERRRNSWSRVTTVMVRKAERQAALEAIQGRHLSDASGHLPPESRGAGFYGEFPWRQTWPTGTMRTELDLTGFCVGLPLIWPVIHYVWEGSSDYSMDRMCSLLPSGWLCEQMGLSPRSGHPGDFIDPSGGTAFISPAAFGGQMSVALIDRQRFLSFIETSEWDCLWLIGGEKNWWPGGMANAANDRWACRYHSGVFWWENGEWQSRTWSDFDSRGV